MSTIIVSEPAVVQATPVVCATHRAWTNLVSDPKKIQLAVSAFVGIFGLLLVFGGYINHYNEIDGHLEESRKFVQNGGQAALEVSQRSMGNSSFKAFVGLGSISMSSGSMGLAITGLLFSFFAGLFLLVKFAAENLLQRKIWVALFASLISAQVFSFIPRMAFLANITKEQADGIRRDNRRLEVIGESGAASAMAIDGKVAGAAIYVTILCIISAVVLFSIAKLRVMSNTHARIVLLHKGAMFLAFQLCIWSFIAASGSLYSGLTTKSGTATLACGFTFALVVIASAVFFEVRARRMSSMTTITVSSV